MPGGDGPIARRESERAENTVSLKRHFRETVASRAERDPAFRAALLREGFEALLT